MNIVRAGAAIAALLLAVIGLAASPGNDMRGTTSMSNASGEMATNRSLVPPIDRRIPGKIETATFALG